MIALVLSIAWVAMIACDIISFKYSMIVLMIAFSFNDSISSKYIKYVNDSFLSIAWVLMIVLSIAWV